MYSRDRYLKRKLKGLTDEQKAVQLKKLIEEETLAKWREMGLKAYADYKRHMEVDDEQT